MSTRTFAGPKPDSVPSLASDGLPDKSDSGQSHGRRRRHTPEHHQDRFLRIVSRVLVIMGGLMMIWLLLRALGWV
ncbi:hypothetical protein [Roseimicrobium gellanilyticum]|uniref:hypothetical protein n=1 Tax=Roseimicrobium gellanilyticum TaxID=748857 RepID=UPI00147677EF|nr:hypothetical protein [Roseimicrobium gellanilyticum]